MAVHTSDRVVTKLRERASWLGRSELAELVLAFDWSRTPMGPIADWPRSLKSAVAICLHAPVQMAIYWGSELNCIYNDAERDVLGKLHPRALGLPARELLRDSWHVVGPQLQAVMEHGHVTWEEDQPLTFDRRGQLEVAYFTYSYSPILDDDGAIAGVLLVTHDTTARVLAERRIDALRRLAARSMDASTERLACEMAASALASGPDVRFALIYLIDKGRKRATCTAAAGVGIRGRSPAVLELEMPPHGLPAPFRALAARIEGTLVDAGPLLDPDHDGQRPPRQAFLVPIARGPRDTMDGFMVAGVTDDHAFDDSYRNFLEMAAMTVGRSVATARAREAERERANSIAALEKAKSTLFSNASHELRTPLALILGNLEQLLDDTRTPQPAQEQIMVARRSAVRMLKLVNALLDFSRIEAGENIGVFEASDVAQLTRDVAAMFDSTARRAGLRLSVDCPSLVDPVCVDREAWERIVSNLLSNALKFTPQGEIRVRTRAHGAYLQLTVEDTGIGIAPEELDHIFSRFYRSPDPRARTHEGSGIGLALVRELVNMHGGSVKAECRPRGGTRMIVRVRLAGNDLPSGTGRGEGSGPAAVAHAALFVAEAEGWFDGGRPPPSITQRSRRAQLEPQPTEAAMAGDLPRVLIAEDNADMRGYLHRLLSPYYSVQLARTGDEAFELAISNPPDILISDAMMPGLDGFALMRELRREPRTRDLPVILVSARADPESTIEALDLGADDYIIKPFGARELLTRVRTTLENLRVRADNAAARGRTEERVRKEGELRALLNDLRAAQRRVAAAGDAERRRVERDLHDGAQQRLMAIRLELGLVREGLEQDPEAAGTKLDEVRHELEEALEELRELAHGLYPPLLASDGLYAALSAAARHSAIPVAVEPAKITRAPRSIESAAYFCCLEALQNAAKHAGPDARAFIDLKMREGVLEFRVRDDGTGFDPAVVRPGYGLINLRDRLEALGGHTEVTSAPGLGTTVLGRIPLP